MSSTLLAPRRQFRDLSLAKIALFTVAPWKDANLARELAKSFVEHSPQVERFFILSDTPRANLDLKDAPEFQHLIPLSDLGPVDFKSFAFRYEPDELIEASLPFAFTHLLARGFEWVIYADRRTCIVGPLTEVKQSMATGALVLLEPQHSLQPWESGEHFNFIAICRGGWTVRLLSEWQAKASGRSHRYPWTRTLFATLDARVRRGLVHRLKGDAVRGQISSAGTAHGGALEYGYDRFTNGEPIPPLARRIFRETLEPFRGDPFDLALNALNRPAVISGRPSALLTYFSDRVRRSRPDLIDRFDLRSAQSEVEYAKWFVGPGAISFRLPGSLTSTVRERLNSSPQGTTAAFQHPAQRLLGNAKRYLPALRSVYRFIPKPVRQRVLQHVERLIVPASIFSERRFSPGLNLIGYPFVENGLGEAMRSLARSTLAAGIPMEMFDFHPHASFRQTDRSMAPYVTDTLSNGTSIFCVNADVLEATLDGLGSSATGERYNIVRPFWELSRLPPAWTPGLEKMDEIWAPSKFVRDVFSNGTTRPVLHVPMAVTLPTTARPNRARFRLPDDHVIFGFAFDLSSYPARKNPLATIEAFRTAFSERPDEKVSLVIKSMGTDPGQSQVRAAIEEYVRADPRIVWIDQILDRADTLELLASFDVFVSLHRSEGFGLAIAESLLLGKTVIATDYSGSTDFLSEDHGFPVPFELVPVTPHDYPYFVAGQVWADPDVSYAARVMRHLATSTDTRRDMGERARRFMRRTHSDEVVGRVIRQRLEEIQRIRRSSEEARDRGT